MPVTTKARRLPRAVGLAAALLIGVSAGAVTWRMKQSPEPDTGASVQTTGQLGAGTPSSAGSAVGPVRLAPRVVQVLQPADEVPPVETSERLRDEVRIAQEMLSNLDDTLAELKRQRKLDEVAMVEAKQAELRAKLSRATQRLDRIASGPIGEQPTSPRAPGGPTAPAAGSGAGGAPR